MKTSKRLFHTLQYWLEMDKINPQGISLLIEARYPSDHEAPGYDNAKGDAVRNSAKDLMTRQYEQSSLTSPEEALDAFSRSEGHNETFYVWYMPPKSTW
jgi:hypothetical protein